MIHHSKPCLGRAEGEALNAVLSSGLIAQGRLVEEFEREASAYLGSAGGVATGSGTAALVLALRALGVAAGGEVVLPTYVCKSVAEAVAAVGAVPVLCDVGERWNMTPETVAPAVTPRTAAIIVVHVFGIPADTRAFRRFGVPLIDDCCQAFGARRGESCAGTAADVGVFSFHAIKCLTTGEGGMAVSGDPRLLGEMRRLRDSAPDSVASSRLAAPMADLQASLGLAQLSRYEGFLRRRRELADLYFGALGSCDVELPRSVRPESIFYRFPVRVRRGEFEAARGRFAERGVQVRRGVDRLLHRLTGADGAAFPVAERLFNETVSIPLYPALEDGEAFKVVEACRAIWEA